MATQRVLLAFAASTVLTMAVTLPMAYQASEARQQQQLPMPEERVQVLGTSVERVGDALTDELYWQADSQAPPTRLHRATLTSAPRISLRDDDVARADFRLDDGPVISDRTSPFEMNDGEPLQLQPGERSLTVTVTYTDGRSILHRASFTVRG
jgi:hypothetical protein